MVLATRYRVLVVVYTMALLMARLVMSRIYSNVSSDEYSDNIRQCHLSQEPPSTTEIGCAILCETLDCLMSQATPDGCVICDNHAIARGPMPVTQPPANMYYTGTVNTHMITIDLSPAQTCR